MSEASERAFWKGGSPLLPNEKRREPQDDIDIGDHELVYDDAPSVVRLVAPPSRFVAARATVLICAGFIVGIGVSMIALGTYATCRLPTSLPVDFTIQHHAGARQ